MKIQPKTYAKSLIESLDQNNVSVVASNFLDLLYRNKQQKDLRKILNLLDAEYAKQNDRTLGVVYSEKALNNDQLDQIKNKFEKKLNQKILIKNIVRKNQLAGVTVEIDGKIYDHSLSGRIESFKQALKQE